MVKDSVEAVPAPKAAVVTATLRKVALGWPSARSVRATTTHRYPPTRPYDPREICSGPPLRKMSDDHRSTVVEARTTPSSSATWALVPNLPLEAARKELIQAEDWASLANHDELRQSKMRGGR